jgi:hypothetical protein
MAATIAAAANPSMPNGFSASKLLPAWMVST